MEIVMPLHPVRRVPNVRAQKQQVCQLLRLPFMITTVQLLLFQSRSLLLENLTSESDSSNLPFAVPLLFSIWDLASHFSGERNIPIRKILSLFWSISDHACIPTHTSLSVESPKLWSEPRAPTLPSPSPVARPAFPHWGLYSLRFTSSASFVSSLWVIVTGVRKQVPV